ncbi:hypothetical protein LCGC14_2661720 [marine sediment metagenome]|uniref:Uncharacterized protein n=1 Tax=marine sediment metagenome TaxID=412755 RepID=A0A0F9C1X5_9ZZZZ
MYNVKVGQLVIFKWVDPSTIGGWNDFKDADLGICQNVGYIAEIRPDSLVTCNGAVGRQLNSDPTIVPWALIYDITVLEDMDWKATKFNPKPDLKFLT